MARIILPEFSIGVIDPLRAVPESRNQFLAGRELAQTGALLGDVMAQSFRVRDRREEEARIEADREEAARERFRLQGQRAFGALAESDIVEAESQALIDFERNIRENPDKAESIFQEAIRDIGPTDPGSLDPDTAVRVDEFARKNIAQSRLMVARAVEGEKARLEAKREAEAEALQRRLFAQRLATEGALAQTQMERLAVEFEDTVRGNPEAIESALETYNEKADAVPEGVDEFQREEMRAILERDRIKVYRVAQHRIHQREVDRAFSAYGQMMETGLERIAAASPEIQPPLASSEKVHLAEDLEIKTGLFLERMLANGIITPDQYEARIASDQQRIAFVTARTLNQTDPQAAALYVGRQADLPEDQRIDLLERVNDSSRRLGLEALVNEIREQKLRLDQGEIAHPEFNSWIMQQREQVQERFQLGAIDEEQANNEDLALQRAYVEKSQQDIVNEQYLQSRHGTGPYVPALMDPVAATQLSLEVEARHASPPADTSVAGWTQHLAEPFQWMTVNMEHLPDKLESTIRDAYLSGSVEEKQAIGGLVFQAFELDRPTYVGSLPSNLVAEMTELGRQAKYAPWKSPQEALASARERLADPAKMSVEEKRVRDDVTRFMGPIREILMEKLADQQIQQPIGLYRNPFELLGPLSQLVNLDIGTVAPNLDPAISSEGTINFYTRGVLEELQKDAAYIHARGYSQGGTPESAVDMALRSAMDPMTPVGMTWNTGGVPGLTHRSQEKELGSYPLIQVDLPPGALGDAYRDKLAGKPVRASWGNVALGVRSYFANDPTQVYEKNLEIFHQRMLLQTQATTGTTRPQARLREGEPVEPTWANWLRGITPWGRPVDPQSVDDLRGLLGFEVEDSFVIQKPVLDSNGEVVPGVTRPVKGWRLRPFVINRQAEGVLERHTIVLPDGSAGYTEGQTGGITSMVHHYMPNEAGRPTTMDVTEEDYGLTGLRDLQMILEMRQTSLHDFTSWAQEETRRSLAGYGEALRHGAGRQMSP